MVTDGKQTRSSAAKKRRNASAEVTRTPPTRAVSRRTPRKPFVAHRQSVLVWTGRLLRRHGSRLAITASGSVFSCNTSMAMARPCKSGKVERSLPNLTWVGAGKESPMHRRSIADTARMRMRKRGGAGTFAGGLLVVAQGDEAKPAGAQGKDFVLDGDD
jgi:hypothetical protein